MRWQYLLNDCKVFGVIVRKTLISARKIFCRQKIFCGLLGFVHENESGGHILYGAADHEKNAEFVSNRAVCLTFQKKKKDV